MSFSQAIGEINQIVQWEQRLVNPAASPLSSAAVPSSLTASPPSSVGSGNGSFTEALAQAQSAGPSTVTTSVSALPSAGASPGAAGSPITLLSPLSSGIQADGGTASPLGATATATATAAGPADPRIQSMIQAADELVGKPYVWGGGHGGWGPQPGYDCSGFVSAVLHAGGYLSAPQDTTSLPSAPGIEPGPGRYVTIYDRTTPGQVGHVIIEINGQFYESGGEQGGWGGGGGVARISTPSAGYLATFNEILHPAGL